MNKTLPSLLWLGALLCPLTAVLHAEETPAPSVAPKEETEMEKSMEVLAKANKSLNTALKSPDPAQKPSYMEWAATMKTEAVKCLDFVPVKIAEMPAEQQPPALESYKKAMTKFIGTIEELEKALQEDRWTDAEAKMKELRKEKSKGHEEFQKEEEE